MQIRLQERISCARRAYFVGRLAERALFEETLAARELPFSILYLFGSAGIGKTALIQEYRALCDSAQVPFTYVDARNVDPSPGHFLDTLRHVLKLTPTVDPVETLSSRSGRQVLILDTYEAFAPLDGWLRDYFFPYLSLDTLVVIADRHPPNHDWHSDIGWQTLLHPLSLHNLSMDESGEFLHKRGVPMEQHEAILDFTHGYPLALSLVADAFIQRQDPFLQPENDLQIVRSLLERIVQRVPGPAHRVALEACAMVRVITEPLLADMLKIGDPTRGPGTGVHTLFEWLCSLSFMESSSEGLFPHDIARHALCSDLRWRNPGWYDELYSRAQRFYVNGLTLSSGRRQQQMLADLLFLNRDKPALAPFFAWQAHEEVSGQPMAESDLPHLLAMVADYEGEESARLAHHWLQSQSQGVRVWRDRSGGVQGFLSIISLEQADPETRQSDPAVRTAWEYLQDRAPLRRDESATMFRFWLGRESYQGVSPTQSRIFINTMLHYLTKPGLAYSFFPCAQPEFWAPMFNYANLQRLPEVDFSVGGKDYGVYGHDWRAMPPLPWLKQLATLEADTTALLPPTPSSNEDLAVLNKPQFKQAVEHALQHFTRPDLLRENVLLRSRLTTSKQGTLDMAEQAERLQERLREGATLLQNSPKQVKFYRVLEHSFFHPAPTQEAAAEVLDIPFSTYRRHLKRAVSEITDILWRWEVDGT